DVCCALERIICGQCIEVQHMPVRGYLAEARIEALLKSGVEHDVVFKDQQGVETAVAGIAHGLHVAQKTSVSASCGRPRGRHFERLAVERRMPANVAYAV